MILILLRRAGPALVKLMSHKGLQVLRAQSCRFGMQVGKVLIGDPLTKSGSIKVSGGSAEWGRELSRAPAPGQCLQRSRGIVALASGRLGRTGCDRAAGRPQAGSRLGQASPKPQIPAPTRSRHALPCVLLLYVCVVVVYSCVRRRS